MQFEVDVKTLVVLFHEMYPKELDHVLSEARARTAEAKLAELDGEEE